MQLPQGFRFAGVASGIKASGKPDVALIACTTPAVAAGVYTQNLVCAPPVHLDRARTPMDHCLGVVVNSGNANACTGEQGMRDAEAMAALAAEQLGGDGRQVLVMSTGVIGRQLPMDKVRSGIQQAAAALGDSVADFEAAATAILTTDQGKKVASRTLGNIRLAGMAKGAGMIAPNMATMLGVLMTDCELSPAEAQQLLQTAADVSFNCIRVEGHTSTNDTLLLLATGLAGRCPDQACLQETLNEMAIELAKQIPADGEGAKHLIEIRVQGCDTSEEARKIANAVADSPLVKTAITGNDPNWGRIVSAAGYAGVAFCVQSLSLKLNGISLFQSGEPTAFDPAEASRSMRDNAEV
ncbi:MAG: bifunctional glutamate N-acetyltransferase/amino-acid acetyltransferase ArgJ, partial [Planctomycetales bacterium]|nr:bifunctional glutamate N-acetyltransferase/amino-acid acetyltransferase ArgJ [Planctomycetales bacterium]